MQDYTEELNNPETNYFVLDSGSNVNHDDIDFKAYSWRKDLNKKIKAGDLFIYRRSGGGSEFSNLFYLFGTGKIGQTLVGSDTKTRALVRVEKPYVFNRKLMKPELTTFPWHFKKYKGKWSNFFNMNGVTFIDKEDFVNLLQFQNDLCGEVPQLTDVQEKLAAYIYADMKMENYFVEDKIGVMDTRVPADKIFNDEVRGSYRYKCPVTSTVDPADLKVVRIVPWEDNKNTRMDPKNGLMFETWLAVAFEQGYVSYSDEGRMVVSQDVVHNEELFSKVERYRKIKLRMNRKFSPKKEYFAYHREHIFRDQKNHLLI
ncbi:hypothetical protein [Companilactobacillus sp.]|jgi:hypothetical protein|uniref:hypothetical protein n=1 Tax=Companilactobacillus sp. TaxID=2767905 RepID=UPI0025BE3F49|nr:hypothetical protein [Companilactobacillus sp.]MCH4009734.1 hypothetical protein [Companilactobacillus sp.]MCH4052590.1 hypothetical protein [Companilactobacillus sp.]MCH4077676.1 hypothetical protein [Companilactobacillus sp.]MCH4126252.1 hypothetical protein [Companilactobacillus sp.]MCI1311960.1 hypothetical protein [Companilactobacillus sp.]